MEQIIIDLLAQWGPAVTAIMGVIITVITTIKKCSDTVSALKEDKTLKDAAEKLEEAARANKELAETNKILIDQIAKIKGYSDGGGKR